MKNILDKIQCSKKVGIGGHIRPDGDCVGSCMALYHYLSKMYPDKQIDVYLEFVPEYFSFLSDVHKIKNSNFIDDTHDIFISLDCGSTDRLGPAEEYFKNAKSTINIDHHISNTMFGQENHVVTNASSTCEVLFSLFEEERIDKDVAEALYLGMIHDTGVFKHSNTSQHTMEIAGKLISKGIEFSKIIDETFYEKTYTQNQILGRCLLESILVLDKRCILSTISKKVMDFYYASPKDLDGIIDQLRVTQGIEVAIFIYEMETQEYKVSMRSNNYVDVSKIAVYFGGGGHVRAAGCTMKGSIYDVINNLTQHIEAQLK